MSEENDDDDQNQQRGRPLRGNLNARKTMAEPRAEESGKRARVDEQDQVNALFSAQPIAKANSPDDAQKRLVFKILNKLKDGQNKTTLDQIWKRYMGMNERETIRHGTEDPLVHNKQELISIIEGLESDNLVMYAAEDGQIILM